MTRNSKKAKLSLKKKSVRELSDEKLGNVRGGLLIAQSLGGYGDSLVFQEPPPPPAPPPPPVGVSDGGTCVNCGFKNPLGGTLGRNHNQGLRR